MPQRSKTTPTSRSRYTRQRPEVYPNDCRAYNNCSHHRVCQGNYDEAKNYLQKALAIDANNGEANANLGLLALQAGDAKTAETYISKLQTPTAWQKCLATCTWHRATTPLQSRLAKVNSNSAALAQILNKNYLCCVKHAQQHKEL